MCDISSPPNRPVLFSDLAKNPLTEFMIGKFRGQVGQWLLFSLSILVQGSQGLFILSIGDVNSLDMPWDQNPPPKVQSSPTYVKVYQTLIPCQRKSSGAGAATGNNPNHTDKVEMCVWGSFYLMEQLGKKAKGRDYIIYQEIKKTP